MICTVACQETEVVRFLGSFHLCLFLNYFNQTTKSNLSKNYYQIWSPKQKTNFIQPRQFFSLLIASFREVLIQAHKYGRWRCGVGEGGDSPPFFEKQKKCPGFGKKNPEL